MLPQIRVHSALLLLNPCSKLWYLCRELDLFGRGYVTVSQQQLEKLQVSRSTIHRWLLEGKKLGFFIKAVFKGNTLHVSLGGLLRVCSNNSIRHWGTTALVPLEEILVDNGRRITASLITIQAFQSSSQYAAKHQLNKLERAGYQILEVDDLLNYQTSQKPDSGGTPGVLHVSETKIWVGRRFIPFGVSQERVSRELNSRPHSCGVSDRTLRRHITAAEVPHKQIVQGKGEYTEIGVALENGATSHKAKGNQDIWFHWYAREPEKIVLMEPQGVTTARREGGHKILPDQFFTCGGRYWLNRCNVYSLDFELKSMRVTRTRLKKISVNFATPEVSASQNFAPPAPPKEDLNIPPQFSRGAATGGNGNKADKNEKFENSDCEKDTANLEHKNWFKEQLVKMQQKAREIKQHKLVIPCIDVDHQSIPTTESQENLGLKQVEIMGVKLSFSVGDHPVESTNLNKLPQPKQLIQMGVRVDDARLLNAVSLAVSQDDVNNAVDAFIEHSSTNEVTNPTRYLIQAIESKQKPKPRLPDNPLQAVLIMWRHRWESLPWQRERIKRDIEAEFPNREIVVLDDIGPVIKLC